MAVEFVPAPGWPAIPKGWLPNASWSPEATWPPAPPGWVFYRGPYGEPVQPPAGSWMPTLQSVPSAPAAAAPSLNAPPAQSTPPQAAFVPSQTASFQPTHAAPQAAPVPVPQLAPAQATPPARSTRVLWIGLAAGALVVALAVTSWFVIPRFFATEPTLGDAQVMILLADPGINASELQAHSGPEEYVPDKESCQKLHAVEVAHMRSYYTGGTAAATSGSTSWVGVLDGPQAAADLVALIGPCNTELGGRVVTPVVTESKGTWTVTQSQGDSKPFVTVRYGNVLAIASSDTVPDPEAYLQAVVTAAERALIG